MFYKGSAAVLYCYLAIVSNILIVLYHQYYDRNRYVLGFQCTVLNLVLKSSQQISFAYLNELLGIPGGLGFQVILISNCVW